jgi:hypothetical protein
MANVIAYGINSIQVTFDGSTAYAPDITLRVVSFEFYPATNADVIHVRNGSATGVTEFYQKAAAADGVADQRKSYEKGYEGNGKNIVPYVVGNEVSANVKLVIKYA